MPAAAPWRSSWRSPAPEKRRRRRDPHIDLGVGGRRINVLDRHLDFITRDLLPALLGDIPRERAAKAPESKSSTFSITSTTSTVSWISRPSASGGNGGGGGAAAAAAVVTAVAAGGGGGGLGGALGGGDGGGSGGGGASGGGASGGDGGGPVLTPPPHTQHASAGSASVHVHTPQPVGAASKWAHDSAGTRVDAADRHQQLDRRAPRRRRSTAATARAAARAATAAAATAAAGSARCTAA